MAYLSDKEIQSIMDDRREKRMSEAKDRCERALRCLHIAVDASVAQDVTDSVMAYIRELEAEVADMRSYVKTVGRHLDNLAELVKQKGR